MDKLKAEVEKARSHKEWKVEYMTLQMKLNEAREEGREEGGVIHLKKTLYIYLTKKGNIPEELREKIEKVEDTETLDRWLDCAFDSENLEAFMASIAD